MVEEGGDGGIERLVGRAREISRYAAWAAGYAVLACAVLIGIEIVLRKLFSFSLQGTDEISGYVLVVTFAWTAAWALFRDAHIRIDVVSSRLPAGPRRIFDLLALASLVGVAILLAWQAVGVLGESLRLGSVSNTPLRVPLWLPQGLWLIGLIGFALAATILLIARLVRPVPAPVHDVMDER
ncbi:MAG: TRAP-type transport system, small permease component [Alphaproteobacteria bacterium]|jgi:TRAP-type mannitol/chloroaromatic compound transport system permease small subunit|nr:TRAP-type transport system, small permease component [Alphaproteobacteria bacterium]